MFLLTLEPPPAAPPASSRERAALALAGVLGCVGEPGFGASALAQLNRALQACWISVYRLHERLPPAIVDTAAFQVEDGTQDAWRAYRGGLYEHDDTFRAARERVGAGETVLTHWHAHEIRREHRQPIYTRHGLRERLSLVEQDGPGRLLAVNLYRHEGQPAFGEGEVDLLSEWGAPLLAAVRLHARLSMRSANETHARPAADHVALHPLLRTLPRREREVCAGLLKGLTYDGIGAELGIGAGTVKTYRDRAFDRLGLHHRNELFALVLQNS